MIFGIHEPGGEGHMLELCKTGWIVFTEGIGNDPNDKGGRDYRQWSDKGLGVIVRLNNGYEPAGTIPNQLRYEAFAQRCANFVENSQGARLWIIGNEMNFAVERPPRLGPNFEQPEKPVSPPARPEQPTSPLEPGAPDNPDAPSQPGGGRNWTDWFWRTFGRVAPAAGPEREDPFSHGRADRFNVINDPASAQPHSPLPGEMEIAGDPATALSTGDGEIITPEMYARCYMLCRERILALPGHGTDKVLVGAVAPWNNQTRYPGNENGDWITYFRDILTALGPERCDGITIHTYTHGHDVSLIGSDAKMNPPFENRHFHFKTYLDFMRAVPASMRHLPVYCTETDQDEPWRDANTGWVQRAYAEINWWNNQPGAQQIHALILYRWPRIDKWYIEGKNGVIADFRDSMKQPYRWKRVTSPALAVKAGNLLRTREILNLRETPTGRVLAQVAAGKSAKVINSAPTLADGVYWWAVETESVENKQVRGWLAQENQWGMVLLERIPGAGQPPTEPPTQPPAEPPTTRPRVFLPVVKGKKARTLDLVRMRKSPGISGKPEGDIIADVPANTALDILDGPVTLDGLIWWQCLAVVGGTQLSGWMAQAAPNGIRLIEGVGTEAPPVQPPAPPEPEPPVTPEPPTPPQPPKPLPSQDFAQGERIVTTTLVRLRKTQGLTDKPADDVLAEIPKGASGVVKGGPTYADDVVWWAVEFPVEGRTLQGWSAEYTPSGITLLTRPTSGPGTPPPQPPTEPPSAGTPYAVGELLVTRTAVNARKSPGMAGKPADDLLAYFEPRFTLNVIEGPQVVEGLSWYRVGGITLARGEVLGWAVEKLSDGALLMAPVDKIPATDIPNAQNGTYLHAPFVGRFGISQLWGENPAIYRRFTYDGVPLKGHNGIDFLTPVGTPLAAVDDAVVADAIPMDPGGFGNYVKLIHGWGESIYAHMDTLGVEKGQKLRKGDVIGTSGNTGFSGGPHLHFAIRIKSWLRSDGWGGFVDPLPYMKRDEVLLPRYVQPARPDDVIDATSPETPPHTIAPGIGPELPGVPRP
jgi:hypothetical protein